MVVPEGQKSSIDAVIDVRWDRRLHKLNGMWHVVHITEMPYNVTRQVMSLIWPHQRALLQLEHNLLKQTGIHQHSDALMWFHDAHVVGYHKDLIGFRDPDLQAWWLLSHTFDTQNSSAD